MQRFAPGVIDYNGVMARNYPAGRALSTPAAETWRSALAPFIPRKHDLTILDLGSGTGRFASFLSLSFSARVIGIEPAHGMRSLAAHEPHPAEVAFVGGTAESIPLRGCSCDVAWLSQVLHHIRDLDACVAELRRVLRTSGVLLVRGTLADGAKGFPTLIQFFPNIRRVFRDLPTIEGTIRTFGAQGFVLQGRHRIEQQTCASLRELAERTRWRADTSLALLPDDEFAAGQQALEDAAAAESPPEPVLETLDLLVFKSMGSDPIDFDPVDPAALGRLRLSSSSRRPRRWASVGEDLTTRCVCCASFC